MSLAVADPTIRPEAALLLACARTTIDAEQAERIRALVQHDLDWPGLIKAARRHAVLPLLYQSLETTCLEAVPPAVLAQLQKFFRNNTDRNLLLTGELLKLLEMCEAHGIPALPFKGPLLAASAYGSLGLRKFVDLDVLIPQPQILKAKELLLAHGYQPLVQLSQQQEKTYLRTNYNYGFRHTEKRIFVELHWGLAPTYFPFRLEFANLWERLEHVSLAGRQVPTLALTDVLLVLCMHGTKHCWEKLGWISDIAELMRRHPEIDWHVTAARAKALGSERMLLLGLCLGKDLLGAALPEAIRHRIQADAITRALARQIAAQFFQDTPDWSKSLAGILFRLRARERWRDKVEYGIRFMLTPTVPDVVRPFPLMLSGLLRPMRLLGEHGHKEWQALRKQLSRSKNGGQ